MNLSVLKQLNPESVEVDVCLVELDAQPNGLESEIDEMWSYVGNKNNPRW